ncbi:hypothetical protein HPB48_022068 [Haemaphysalis longicornis]|uniref:Uncharacterized protein n=1 Tax=Haemaphysalis longicornis TaxID=44386 RepID=A0A9J6GMG7_HAELO|nr:hypothetical protein HPB48_022068 [Haemaphysalis longicornis]
MARDYELEAERAKTRVLERLVRLAEAEFLARPGNENVVRPCCSCGQTTHSSADCRRYRYLDREASPPPQRERWVEVADSEAGERPRLVTAAGSGISKRRPCKVGSRLVGLRVPTKPFKLKFDTVNEIAVLKRIFTPDQLTRPAKSVSLASREGAIASPAVLPPSRAIVGGTSAAQPRVAESTAQATGQAGTLAAKACAGKVVAGLVSDCAGKAKEPGSTEASPLRSTAVGIEAVGQTANADLGASKSLPYRDRPCPKGLHGTDATADGCGGKTPAGTAADGRVRGQDGGAMSRDPDLHAIQLPSAQTCA